MDAQQETLNQKTELRLDPKIVLRLREEVIERSHANPVEFLKKTDPVGWSEIERRYGDVSLRPAIRAERFKKLVAYQRQAAELDQRYEPADFRAFFYVEAKGADDPWQLARDLQRLSPVRGVDVEALGPPPLVDPTDDPRFTAQGYLGAAPAGIDAVYAWSVPGGDGTGQHLVDVEGGWTLNHEDLTAQTASIVHGVNEPTWADHGTSVLGEVCAVDNAVGCVGIAPNIDQVRCSSIFLNSFGAWDTAEAILASFDELRFGDVLLIELQVEVYRLYGVAVYGPMEVVDLTYEAVRLATALGFVVIAAGGNGFNNGGTPAVDLDTYIKSGAQILNPNSPDFRDSGAIMVAAATSAAPHFRLAYSTHGARIDCYSWGQNVETTDSDSSFSTTMYTSGFGGTSSASPIIAGAALLLQGAFEAANGFRLSPWQIRNLLSDPTVNTPPATSEPTPIGVQPNLAAIFNDAAIGMVPDVYVRDNLTDTGDIHTGWLSMSPDIIVRNSRVTNPQAAFGEGSGTENSLTLSDTVEFGQDNYVYVRALNQGSVDATPVRATVYWSEVSTLVAPADWHLIGTVDIADVPTGETLHCSPELVWNSNDIPAPGHYCFVAVLDHPLDPAPTLADLGDFDTFLRYVRNNNNIAWRNFNVHDVAPNLRLTDEIRLRVRGWPDLDLPFGIEFNTQFPANVELLLEIPAELMSQFPGNLAFARSNGPGDVVEVKLPHRGKFGLGVGLLPAKSSYDLKLKVRAPEGLGRKGRVTAVQRYAGKEEVGRVTWLYRPIVDDKKPGRSKSPGRPRKTDKTANAGKALNGKTASASKKRQTARSK